MHKQIASYIPKLFFSLCLFANVFSALSQGNPGLNQTKSSEKYLFFDKSGNKYKLNDLRIENNFNPNGKLQSAVSTTSCNAGYYNLYFEIGSGMEGSTAIEVARRNVICQLFSDLSVFINSPLTSSGNKINIWVRDIANMGVTNPFTNPTLGVGSQFFCIPNIQFISGIADNMIYQTILSGQDAYTNVAAPLYSGTSNGGNYYHGAIAFNFSNPGFSFHTNLSLVTASGTYDLYSVALHEFTHALGFGSLIDQMGQSKFGSPYPYYSRYDMFLKTQTNVPLIVNTTTMCTMYNYTFNPSLSSNILQPGFTSTSSCTPDSTICSSAINYVGSITQPVYTPDCFSGGSTLSHFEDQCQVPASFTVTPSNNKYFVMSNAYNTGSVYMKRYLKPEERSVLCDLGYNVNTTYGSAPNLNFFNYSGSPCSGIQISGINDGISSLGFYTYTTTLNTPVSLTGLLTNDFNATSFECLEVISGSGNLSAISGTSAAYTPNGNAGAHLLRYIPISSTGDKGNITYVFVFIMSGACTPNNCDMINNGDFESGVNCGQIGMDSPPPIIDCWNRFNILTPDYFVRGCANPYATIPTAWTPSVETWNNGLNNNNKFLGLYGGSGGYSDGMIGQLNSPIIPGASYVLNFWARTTTFFNLKDTIDYVMFAGSIGVPALFGVPDYTLSPPLIELNRTLIPSNNQWNHFSIMITNTTLTTFNYLTVLNPAFINTPTLPGCYFVIDDISLKPINAVGTFSLPATICENQTLPDLSIYVSTPDGVFSGTNVVNSSGIFSFSSLSSGNFPIVYTTTNSIGCQNQVVATISVNPMPIISVNSPTAICIGESATLTISGGNTYSLNSSPTNTVIVITPSVTTNYTITSIGINGCTNSSVFTQSVNACIGINEISWNNVGIKIYPNPNNGTFQLKIDQEIKNGELILFNSIGQKVHEQKIFKVENNIITKELSEGLYNFIILQDNIQIKNGKIVIE